MLSHFVPQWFGGNVPTKNSYDLRQCLRVYLHLCLDCYMSWTALSCLSRVLPTSDAASLMPSAISPSAQKSLANSVGKSIASTSMAKFSRNTFSAVVHILKGHRGPAVSKDGKQGGARFPDPARQDGDCFQCREVEIPYKWF